MTDLLDTAEKIRTMEIRGAGRIAREAAAALRDYAGAIETRDLVEFTREMERAAEILTATRPTAVSLPNAVHRVMGAFLGSATVDAAKIAVRSCADAFITSSEAAVSRIGTIGARHIRDGDVVMTHCNSDAALRCLIEARLNGRDFTVFATEVRPRNQGHITIRTLNEAGIDTSFIVDSAVRSFMNQVDLVVVGADAVAVNGAVVNKIGTSQIALAAHEARTNLVVAAETYKFAPRTIFGELIAIEERDSGEVLEPAVLAGLPHVRVRNPAFDVTPPEYIDLIITEEGAIPPGMAYIIIREYLGWDIHEFNRDMGP